MTAALDELQRAYAEPLAAAREAKARGQLVVGLVGSTIPVELVLAAGAFPVTVRARRGAATPAADIYMEEVASPETRSLFEMAVGGELAFLDLLILSRPYAHLYYYLKEVYRLGRGPNIPPLWIYDLMQSQREALRAYNWGRIQELAARLERLGGRTLDDAALRSAIQLTNGVRAVQRRLCERRWAGSLSSVEAMQALGAGAFLHAESYAGRLATYVDELPASESTAGRPRLLLVSSEPLAYLDLHQAVEAAGGRVVAEDDWWGARAPGNDVPLAGVALDAVLQKYWLDTASDAVSPAEPREAWFKEQASRAEVDGILFSIPPSDHHFGWDYPRLRDWVADLGKPQLLLRDDATDTAGQRRVQQQVAAFVNQLSQTRRAA